jgi:peptide/nickel transport system substrate-binding protein
LLKDTGVAASGLLSPLNWAYEEQVNRWPYDPARARQLLDDAGYRDPDGAGPQPRFRLSFKTTNVDLRRRIAEALKEQLAQVGIELEIRTYEGALQSDVKKATSIFTAGPSASTIRIFTTRLFHSASLPPNSGDNRGRYRNPEVDKAIATGARPWRRRNAKTLQEYKTLSDELPYIRYGGSKTSSSTNRPSKVSSPTRRQPFSFKQAR